MTHDDDPLIYSTPEFILWQLVLGWWCPNSMTVDIEVWCQYTATDIEVAGIPTATWSKGLLIKLRRNT